jgi:hypothetical protein
MKQIMHLMKARIEFAAWCCSSCYFFNPSVITPRSTFGPGFEFFFWLVFLNVGEYDGCSF